MGHCDVAQICLDGHVIAASAGSSPQFRQEFCDRCGERTTMECPECQGPIRGYYSGGLAISYDRPTCCHACGKPHPWTARSLDAARHLADDLDELTPEAREKLKGTLDDLIRDTPQARTAAVRFKRYVAKAGPVAADGFRQILTDLVSETVRKTIWGVTG